MTIALYQRPAFKRVYKKLHANQRDAVHDAMRALVTNPLLKNKKDTHFNCLNKQGE